MERRVQLELQDKINIELFGVFSCSGNWIGREHVHPFGELIYTSTKDLAIIGNPEHLQGYIVPPMVTHAFMNSSNSEITFLYIGFNFELCNDEMDNEKYRNIQRIIQYPVIEGQLKKLLEQLQNADIDRLDSARGTVMQLLSTVFSFCEFSVEASMSSNIISRKIIRFLNMNLHMNVTVHQLAEMLYLSPKYVGEVFKNETGESIKRYHARLRMQQALLMIATGKCTITEISKFFGYENPQYFSKIFKSLYDVYPSKWRNR
ncbi:MAG: AraC family transcriptional regulator [Saccharofermentanales bacterium]